MRQRQEKSRIENPVVSKALNLLGVPSIPLKLVAGSDTGRPDDLFLIPYGRPLFIEFKWGENVPEPKQLYWHKVFRDLGYDVEVHNNVDEALTSIALKVVAAALYATRREVPPRTWRGDPHARSWAKKDLHYTRSIQFLEEKGCSEEDAGYRALESRASSLAC